MANDENLTPYEKGQSGNPAGKPKGALNAKTIINELLAMPIKKDHALLEEGNAVTLTAGQHIWLKQLKAAMDGDGKATDRLYDRSEGKPVTREISTETTMAELLNALDRQEAEDE